jgi:GxxExxY protein
MESLQFEEITKTIIGCAYNVHNALGAGYYEKVYQKALQIAMTKAGLKAIPEYRIEVFYEKEMVGEYYADFLVNDLVLLELKAVENLMPAFEVQLVNNLAGAKLDIGLLINFGSSVTVKRKFRVYKATK